MPRLPVKSDRIRSVLEELAKRGNARIRDIRNVLALLGTSANALFQYLKRKELVAKESGEANAPYCLTETGWTILEEMRRREALE